MSTQQGAFINALRHLSQNAWYWAHECETDSGEWRTPLRAHQLRINHLKRKFGLSEKLYKSLLEKQLGLCAICKEKMNPACVDHNHKTKEIRGLLCRSCNVQVGVVENFLPRIQTYLEIN